MYVLISYLQKQKNKKKTFLSKLLTIQQKCSFWKVKNLFKKRHSLLLYHFGLNK